MKDYALNNIIGLSLILNPPSSNNSAVHGASLADIQDAYKIDDDQDDADELDIII